MGGFWEEASDVISFSLSLHEFIKNPNWKTGGWLALDTIGIVVPFVPAIGGYIQKSAEAAKAADKALVAAIVIGKVDDAGKVVEKTAKVKHSKIIKKIIKKASKKGVKLSARTIKKSN